MDDRRRSFLRTTSALLLLAQVASAAPALAAPAPAPAASTVAPRPEVLVAKGLAYYREARYDEAVGLLSGPILRKELAGDELREARLVMARCYVKKGITTRAKEYFGAVIASDPTLTGEQAGLDAEELAVFNQVKGVPATPPATPSTKPAPEAKTPPAATEGEKPQLRKPVVAAGPSQPGWFSRNKYLAIGLIVGGGVAVGLAAGGGGGGGSSPPPGPTVLPGFPAVPSGH